MSLGAQRAGRRIEGMGHGLGKLRDQDEPRSVCNSLERGMGTRNSWLSIQQNKLIIVTLISRNRRHSRHKIAEDQIVVGLTLDISQQSPRVQ